MEFKNQQHRLNTALDRGCSTTAKRSHFGKIASVIGAVGILLGAMTAVPAQTRPTQSDSVVAVVADAQGLPLVPPDELPIFGTFWTVQSSFPFVLAPMPCPPLDPGLPVYAISTRQFLVDQTGGQVLSPQNRPGELRTADVASALAQQVDALAQHIAQVQAAELQSSGQLSAMATISPPLPGEGGGGSGTNDGGGIVLNRVTPTTNDLWLEINASTNSSRTLVIHPLGTWPMVFMIYSPRRISLQAGGERNSVAHRAKPT